MSHMATEEATTLDFLNEFMKHLMADARWTPKVQLERIVGPLLTPFIGELMTSLFDNHKTMVGQYKLICDEFPLKKDTNHQSTNADWLLFNAHTKELVLLELKTNDHKPNGSQLSQYLALRQEASNDSSRLAARLLQNFNDICLRTNSKNKYQHQLTKLKQNWPDETISGLKIVYLLPETAAKALRAIEFDSLRPDYVFNFKDLPAILQGNFSAAWPTIRKYLVELDDKHRPETQDSDRSNSE